MYDKIGRHVLLSLLLVLLCATDSQAHKVKMFAAAEGNVITGYVYYTTGGKPKQAVIQIEDQNGNTLGETMADDNGEFTVTADVRRDYTFILELADGHRATFTVNADELPESLPEPESPSSQQSENLPDEIQHETSEPPADISGIAEGPPTLKLSPEELEKIVDKAVGTQIRLLRQQIEGYEEKIRLHDIVGGIGYIIGLMGLGYFLSSRKKK